MQIIPYPSRSEWPKLLARPTQSIANIEKDVAPILAKVQKEGDAALRALALKFDKTELVEISMPKAVVEAAESKLTEELKAAIRQAYANIRKFRSYGRRIFW